MEVSRQEHLDIILQSPSRHKLIVAGPGTGKTYTFKELLIRNPGNNLVMTFINNLVADMAKDLAYVADVSSRTISPFLRVTALWGGQQGSLLFRAWLMAGFVASVLLRKWQRNRDLLPHFIATSMLTTAFFVGLGVFISNPFARLWHMPGAVELATA